MIPVVRASCADYRDAERALRQALDGLGSSEPLAAAGEPVLLKPNLLAPRPADAAVTTHPAVVEAAIRLALDLGARPLVADSPGLHSAARVAQVCGIAEVCRRYEVPLLDLGQGEPATVSGRVYRELVVAREALEARWLWNLAKWKTHTMMGLTLAVKNLYGCVPGKRKVAAHFRSGKDHDQFARLLLDLAHLLRPRLNVLDGVTALDGPGPGRGRPVARHLLLVSADPEALDWVATRLSGFAANDVPTVRRGLKDGTLQPDTVREVGDPAEPLPFDPAPGGPCDWPLPRPLRRLARGIVSPAPRFDPGPLHRVQCVCGGVSARGVAPGHTAGASARAVHPLLLLPGALSNGSGDGRPAALAEVAVAQLGALPARADKGRRSMNQGRC